MTLELGLGLIGAVTGRPCKRKAGTCQVSKNGFMQTAARPTGRGGFGEDTGRGKLQVGEMVEMKVSYLGVYPLNMQRLPHSLQGTIHNLSCEEVALAESIMKPCLFLSL